MDWPESKPRGTAKKVSWVFVQPKRHSSVHRPLPEDEVILVYRKTIRPLYSYVSKRVGGDQSLAEDLVQETWLRALDDWSCKGVPNDPLAWLVRVARNNLVTHFRRLRPESIDPALIRLEDDKLSPADADSVAVVGWGLAQLRPSYANLLEAFYFEGKAVNQIAAEHSLSERAVEGRLRRARSLLRKKLGRIRRSSAVSGSRTATGGTENVR